MSTRSGRRPGNPDTREAILAAARTGFAEHGYHRTSIRRIATSAGVDPALVHHYFGSKEKLFVTAVNFPVDPADVLPGVIGEGVTQAGERLVRTFVTVWDSPAGASGVALLRSAVSSESMAALMREFLSTQVLERAMTALRIDPVEAPLRASLIASQLAGLAVARYVLRIEPLASAPVETVVAAVAPTIHRYLTGDLPAPPSGPAPPN